MILDYPKMRRITEQDIRDALDDMVTRNSGKPVNADHDLNVFKNMANPENYLRVYQR